ncbi:hypothetical protein ACOSQ2_026476 [Xanthoceras sorbifolium]
MGGAGKEAVTCNPIEMSPCLPALTTPALPTMGCCGKLREQIPCLCGYLQNPIYRAYIDSPNGRKIATHCAVSFPSCPP